MIDAMRWCAPGFEDALTRLEADFRAATWPEPPESYTLITRPRAMRMVLRGTVDRPDGHLPVIVKWSRPDTMPDHVSKRLRGGKGVREGRVLRALTAGGIRAPEPVAFTDENLDLLVTAEVPDLQPLPPADGASRAEIDAVAAVLAAMHAAGVRHRDLHAGNMGITGGAPVLVDAGSARRGKPLNESERIDALARARNGLLAHARRTQRLRALVAYWRSARRDDGIESARALARRIEERAQQLARRYRRGRDRRATRTGIHFVRYGTEEAPRAIRWREGTDEAWESETDAWLRDRPAGARSLKQGDLVCVALGPGGHGQVVAKYYGPVAAGRLPRPLRAFRRAYALQNRHVRVPQPLAAAARADGSGFYAAAWIEGENLHAFTAGGRDGTFGALPFRQRVALLEKMGRTLRAMHENDVSHRDLKAPNVLVGANGMHDLWIADLDGVRIRRGRVNWARRARDLARLDASLGANATDRMRVLRSYMRVLPTPPVTLRRMAERIDLHVRRKRGPSGAPR